MSELDPLGKSQHEEGSKLDAGKLRAGLMLEGFANALLAVSEVTTKGAAKYTPRGWETVPNGIERYTDAMVRHQLKELTGEKYDTDTGCLHAAQLAWNALARLELMIRENNEQGKRPFVSGVTLLS